MVEEPRDVLVGGMGLGFTMHRVLADTRVERCTVVEIEEALVGWMRDGTIPHGQTMLADARANPVVADVTVALPEAGEASYDLVLLDVDNGPNFLVHESNARIYEAEFLAEARRILRPGGAWWSGRWTTGAGAAGGDGRGLRRRRRARRRRSGCRTATSSTGSWSAVEAGRSGELGAVVVRRAG